MDTKLFLVNNKLWGTSGNIIFSTFYTYTLTYNDNQKENTGAGYSGDSNVFKGGTHSSGTTTPPEEKIDYRIPQKEPIHDCTFYYNSLKSEATKVRNILDTVKKDPVYPQNYTTYADYMEMINQDPSNEYSTTLNQYEDNTNGVYHRLTKVIKGDSLHTEVDHSSTEMVAYIHNHPNNTPPSFLDILLTASFARMPDKRKFKGSFVYNKKDNSFYMISVTDKRKVDEFYLNYRRELDKSNNWFNTKGELEEINKHAQKSFRKLDPENQHIYTLAYLLQELDAGLSIIRINKDKAFNEYTISEAFYVISDLRDDRKYILPIKCE